MLKKIAVFVAVAEERSFTAAAKRLRIAQPWLSVQLKQFEDSLGFAVLTRNKRIVELTPAGEEIFGVARRLVDVLGEFNDRAEHLRRRSGRNLIIGCEPSTIHDPAKNHIISSFLKTHKDISLRVLNDRPEIIFKKLADKQIDIVYAPLPGVDQDHPLTRYEILETGSYEIVLLAPQGHPIADGKTVCQSALKGQKILTGNKDYSNEFKHFQQAVIAEIDWVVPPELEYESRSHMVQTLGIPSFWILYPEQPVHVPDDLVIVHFEQPLYCRFGCIHLKDHNIPAVRKFMSLAIKTAQAVQRDLPARRDQQAFEART